jgi:hypothetical protein
MDAILTKDNRDQDVPVKTTKRKQKPFTKDGKQDMTELLQRIEDAKIPIAACPLANCVSDFTEIKENLTAIKTKLDIFLGNGKDGLFQTLEKKVNVNGDRISSLERMKYGLIVGLIVLNLAVQVGLKFFWARP